MNPSYQPQPIYTPSGFMAASPAYGQPTVGSPSYQQPGGVYTYQPGAAPAQQVYGQQPNQAQYVVPTGQQRQPVTFWRGASQRYIQHRRPIQIAGVIVCVIIFGIVGFFQSRRV
jgi:hypothetical protein